MPKRQRRLGMAGYSGALTAGQMQELVIGVNMFAGTLLARSDDASGLAAVARSEFDSREAKRAAWLRHRPAVIAHCKTPGRRPSAYYQFDLQITPPTTWPRELRLLVERTLVDAAESAALEKLRPVLAVNPDLYANWNASADASVLQALVLNFETAAWWHRRWPEDPSRCLMAERYAALATAARQKLTTIALEAGDEL
jgi:hypothetical protein